MDKGHVKQYAVGLAVATIFASAGMVYGWAAPITVRLQSNNSEIPINEEEGGYVIAAIEFGDVFTPIPAGFIADRFGRKPVILSAVPLYLIGWALIILTRSFSALILARILFGMAMGIIFSVGPIYLGEIAEPEIRGKVTLISMSSWFFGMVASYSIGPYVSYSTFSYVSITVPVSLAFILCFIPESPYNLLSRGKYKEASKALKKIRGGNDAAIEKEMKLIKDAIDELGGRKMSCVTLLIDPCCRMSLFLIIILGLVALFGGVTVMYAYATEIFQKIDGIPLDADQCTIFLGVIYCILCLVATGLVDRFGRRPLLLISAGGSGLCHFITGLYFYLQDHTSVDVSSHGWILLLAVGSYCIFTSIGINPITPVYQGEIFPDGVKGIASGLFILEQCTLSMIALKLFQVINSNFGKHVSFWFFSFINVAGVILMYIYLIETKGKTLAEIQREFKIRLKIIERSVDTKETIPFKSDA